MKKSYSIKSLALFTALAALGICLWQQAHPQSPVFHFHNNTSGNISDLEVSIDSLMLEPTSIGAYGYPQIQTGESIRIGHGLEHANISLSYSFNGRKFTYTNIEASGRSTFLFQTEPNGEWTHAEKTRDP